MKPFVVGIHEAKTQFSKLVKRVEAGQEVIVKSHDRPVARLVPYVEEFAPRVPGLLRGKITIKPGFNELPEGFEVFAD